MNSYLSYSIQGNFIAVSWTKLSRPILNSPVEWFTGYLEVVPNLPIVSKRVAEFIYWLCQNQVLSLSQLHIIGHSLGSHISGEVGSRLQKLLGGERVRRITGLDPAGPLLQPPIILEEILDKEDANFVDVIHTNVGVFGDFQPNGDVDIYVNNGKVQPGCWKPGGLYPIVHCSHGFAIRVYVAGFRRLEIACECSLWKYFIKQCHNPCVHPILVGPYCSEEARGTFHLVTSENP